MRPMRQRLPARIRDLGRAGAVTMGRATAGARCEPTFLIVGAQRCGTTSLFRALMTHPNVLRPVMHKGVNYFDLNYERDWRWYLGHFPLTATAHRRRATGQRSAAVFEASGYYMFHPHAAARIAERLPGVRVVAMVRDPVERAYSAYKHELARGFETESFERALELEGARVDPELARMIADPTYQSESYRHHAYRRRGQYAEQIERFVERLGREQVHVVESERFFTDSAREYLALLAFLRLPPIEPPAYERFNASAGSPMVDAVRDELGEHFRPHDAILARLLGRAPVWTR